MRYLKYILVVAASLALFACGNKSTAAGTGVISLTGGNGGSGAGGNGGKIITLKNYTTAVMQNFSSAAMGNFSSAIHGDLKFHSTGAVNAGFSVPSLSQNFSNISTSTTVAQTITTETFVKSAASTTPGDFFVQTGDLNLYFVSSSGTSKQVTGLTVNAKLHLPNNNGTLISGEIVINSTVTSDGAALDLRSGSLLQVNGQVTTAGGQLKLFSGGTLINQGTIDSGGAAGSGISAGGITLEAGTFLYNTGNVFAKGDGAGNGGAIQLLADAASVATSGTVDSSGGSGATGGNAGAIKFSGGSTTAIGRVDVEGTVNGNGGIGAAGAGGAGAKIVMNSFSGGILVSATISASGGEGKGTGNGGDGGSLRLNNDVGSAVATQHLVSPEGIKVAGNITLNGGIGAGSGGNGGTLSIASGVVGDALQGFANVEFFGYQAITLGGGAGGTGASATGGNGGTILAAVSSPASIVGVDIPAGGVVNELTILARGGDNNPNAPGLRSAAGGAGGNVLFVTPESGGTADPQRSLVTNSGGLDLSGGAGNSGGTGGRIVMRGYGNLTVSGGITARGGGGTGTTSGAAGGSVKLFSASNVTDSGGITVSGGDGNTGGNGGTVSLSSGNQTTTAGILANGGNSLNGSNGGNGGTIALFSEYALTNRSGLNVARGSGGTTATNGSITIDGTSVIIPAGGAI